MSLQSNSVSGILKESEGFYSDVFRCDKKAPKCAKTRDCAVIRSASPSTTNEPFRMIIISIIVRLFNSHISTILIYQNSQSSHEFQMAVHKH